MFLHFSCFLLTNLIFLIFLSALKRTKAVTFVFLSATIKAHHNKWGDFMIIREAYISKIVPLIDKNLIKVLTGVRRSGKTVLLSQIQDYLLKNGRSKSQIVNISLESKKPLSKIKIYSWFSALPMRCGVFLYLRWRWKHRPFY